MRLHEGFPILLPGDIVNRLPVGTSSFAEKWIKGYSVRFKVSKPRKTIHGSCLSRNREHFITINDELNPYCFLITFVHEIAHMHNHQYGLIRRKNRRLPHGKEWKKIFSSLLLEVTNSGLLPEDVHQVFVEHALNPKSTSNKDISLLKVLNRYDKNNEDAFLEEIPVGATFEIGTKRCFQKGERIRTRYKCLDLNNKRHYLIGGAARVKIVS